MDSKTDMASCICCGCCSEICRRSNPAVVMKDLIAMERDIYIFWMFRDTKYVILPLSRYRIRCGPAA